MILGFCYYSYYFIFIQLVLNMGDEMIVCILLVEWIKQDIMVMDVSEILCIVFECVFIIMYCYVFGVFFWFLMLVGLVLVVMY